MLPTIACSFCRSQCRPRPWRARCSRITAMPRLVPSRPPYSFGNAYRKCPAASARLRASASSASHSRLGRPPRSQSVLASSRRWSKNLFVVVLPLERPDLALDELVEFGQVVAQVLGEGEVHGVSLISGDGQVGGVGDGELVGGRGADRLGDLAEAVVQRAVADLRAEFGVVGAAEGGEPGPVRLLVGRGQQGLALGDAQRVGRDPGVKPQDRVRGSRPTSVARKSRTALSSAGPDGRSWGRTGGYSRS